MSDAGEGNDNDVPKEGIPTEDDSAGQAIAPGSRIGQFRIGRELGHGGMGVVYLAEDTKLERQVAIKSLPAQFVKRPEAQSRFQREAKLLASLNHPNIATIHDIIEAEEGEGYLILEYIPGETLAERIAQGAMKPEEAVSIACQVADAVAAAHEHGVIHRDLKPGNIKITPQGTVKVLDFGLAKTTGMPTPDGPTVTITQPGQAVGTPAYMSPEQARGNPADHRTDIWSFGSVLFEMLAGKRPFSGKTATEVIASVLKSGPDWDAISEEAGPNLRNIIGRCLKKEPEARYQSATDLCHDLKRIREALTEPAPRAINFKAFFRSLRKPRVAIPVLLVIAVLFVGAISLIRRNAKIRWARVEALPQIISLIDQEKYLAAFSLAEEAEKYIPDDPMLKRLCPEMSREFTVITTPPGADVYFRVFNDFDGKRQYLGKTPLERVRFPLGVFRWEIEKKGFETRECVAESHPTGSNRVEIPLQKKEDDPGMLLIPVPDEGPYLIDKYEVTNEQFQKFVDDGGYGNEELWKQKFMDEEGREIPRKEAMAQFVDSTGRPGPATWEGGTFREGRKDYPVAGVSWYEAAAYAQSVGKDLPVIDAWEHAATRDMSLVIVPYSNFRDGLAPVGEHKGVGAFGVYDMAGNVKEWCWNATDDSESKRYILGGSWADPEYVFTGRDTRPPMNREETNGFRCARYFGPVPADRIAPKEPIRHRDYLSVPQPSEEEFQSYLSHYDYDKNTPLNPSREVVDDGSRHWRKERIEFDAAYGDDERVIAYLFLPKGVKPPYQPVVYFPGIGTTGIPSSAQLQDFEVVDFTIKSGRAVLYPVYKGTYERRLAKGPAGPKALLNWIVQTAQDLRRSVDYLEQRAKEHGEFKMEKLTYYGFSWGGLLGPVMVAVENRTKFAIFIAGGFYSLTVDPAGDPVRFASRVHVPVLMVNGKHDSRFPMKTSVEPMYEVMRVPEENRKVYDGGHGVLGLFSSQIRSDLLKWLDEHLGPVH